jgi:isopenicillin N synthase-like dioxygenase
MALHANTRDSGAAIPLLDLSPYYEVAAAGASADSAGLRPLLQAIDAALRDIGFMCIRGHRVLPEIVAETQDTAFGFFDLPAAQKETVRALRHRTRGYTPLGDHSLGYTMAREGAVPPPPDTFERYRIGPFDLPDDEYTRSRRDTVFAPNVWPDDVTPAFRPVMSSYYRLMSGLARDLMRLFALALGLPAEWYDHRIDREMSALAINHYPAAASEPSPGQMRASAHTDYGTLTIVAPTAAPGGLQVMTRNGGWESVSVAPGTFVVNIGDLMAQWTNDRWVSTLHRVVNPERSDAARSRRLSLVYFHQPNEDALIECIPTCVDQAHPARYAPVTAGEHIARKIRKHFMAAA